MAENSAPLLQSEAGLQRQEAPEEGRSESCAKELCTILKMLLPNMFQLYLVQFVSRVTLGFVGHYDPSTISVGAAGVGTMYSNITGMSIGIGMTMASGSYAAQNQGRQKATENGVVVRQVFKAHILCFFFAACMAGFSDTLLGLLGQPIELLLPVRAFALVNVMTLPPCWLGIAIINVLVAQGVFLAGLLMQVFASCITFSFSWWLLSHGYGYLGLAYANALGQWAGFLYLVLYVVCTGKAETVWQVPSVVTRQGRVSFADYLKSTLPSALSLWAEWWAAESLALFAGLIGKATVAAYAILLNTVAIFYMTFVAFSQACQMRTGFYIGAQDPAGAKLSIALCMLLALIVSTAVAMLLGLLGPRILSFYTRDERILSVARRANLGIVFSIPPYAMMMCLLGAFRSIELQWWAATAVAAAFYMCGIPLAYYLGLVAGVGLLGIWIGNVTACALASVLMSGKILTVDFSEVSVRSTSNKSDLTVPETDSAKVVTCWSGGCWGGVMRQPTTPKAGEVHVGVEN